MSKKPQERRCFPVEELRVHDEDGGPRIQGYAALFNSRSENLGGFHEIIKPGAFTKTLNDGADVRALWNHDPNFVLGRTKSGTLKLEQDARGLRVDITPPDTQWAKDHVETIRRGDVSQMSFGFRVIDDNWRNDEESALQVRELREVSLFDVSPVTYPAYPQTTVDIRSTLESKGIDPDKFVDVLNGTLQPTGCHDIVEEIRSILADPNRDEGQPESSENHSNDEPDLSDHHSSEPTNHRLCLLRKRLELAEREAC